VAIPGRRVFTDSAAKRIDHAGISLLPSPMSVELIPMEPSDFERFRRRTIPSYAQAKVAAGEWSAAEAAERADAELGRLLPQGVVTARNHLLVVTSTEDGRRVGELWVAERQVGERKIAMILDLYIEETERRRGFGKQSLLRVESFARQLGCAEVRLQVFGDNLAARKLYEGSGYSIRSLIMAKSIPPASAREC
jgi:ribosomal protein S18 acetylase RimI-like enzyme